jgi:hypothetical protein
MKGNGKGRRLSDRLFHPHGVRPSPRPKPCQDAEPARLGWVGSLEIEQDLAFERKSWRAERAGRYAVLLILLAALAGLAGRGPLSAAKTGGPGLGMELSYQRFERLHVPTKVEMVLYPAQPPDAVMSVWIQRAYLDAFDVQRVFPEPARAVVGPRHVRYDFTPLTPGEPLAVAIALEPKRPGPVRGRWGLEPGPRSVGIQQFVYP